MPAGPPPITSTSRFELPGTGRRQRALAAGARVDDAARSACPRGSGRCSPGCSRCSAARRRCGRSRPSRSGRGRRSSPGSCRSRRPGRRRAAARRRRGSTTRVVAIIGTPGERGPHGAGGLGDGVALDGRRRDDADRAHQRGRVAEREVDEVDQRRRRTARGRCARTRRARARRWAPRRPPAGRRRRRRSPAASRTAVEHLAREPQAVLERRTRRRGSWSSARRTARPGSRATSTPRGRPPRPRGLGGAVGEGRRAGRRCRAA